MRGTSSLPQFECCRGENSRSTSTRTAGARRDRRVAQPAGRREHWHFGTSGRRLGAQDKRVVVIDADPQGSALDWSTQRANEDLPRPFGVLGLARDTLHVEAVEIAHDVNHVVIGGSSRIAALMRSAMLAADLALVPAQPSPFDGWASGDTLRLLQEVRFFGPQLIARVVLARCDARTVIASEVAEALANHEPPALASRVSQRVAFAGGRAHRTACVGGVARRRAAREVAALTDEIERIAR
jgi:chromosome partitioning protein